MRLPDKKLHTRNTLFLITGISSGVQTTVLLPVRCHVGFLYVVDRSVSSASLIFILRYDHITYRIKITRLLISGVNAKISQSSDPDNKIHIGKLIPGLNNTFWLALYYKTQLTIAEWPKKSWPCTLLNSLMCAYFYFIVISSLRCH